MMGKNCTKPESSWYEGIRYPLESGSGNCCWDIREKSGIGSWAPLIKSVCGTSCLLLSPAENYRDCRQQSQLTKAVAGILGTQSGCIVLATQCRNTLKCWFPVHDPSRVLGWGLMLLTVPRVPGSGLVHSMVVLHIIDQSLGSSSICQPRPNIHLWGGRSTWVMSICAWGRLTLAQETEGAGFSRR